MQYELQLAARINEQKKLTNSTNPEEINLADAKQITVDLLFQLWKLDGLLFEEGQNFDAKEVLVKLTEMIQTQLQLVNLLGFPYYLPLVYQSVYKATMTGEKPQGISEVFDDLSGEQMLPLVPKPLYVEEDDAEENKE